MNPSSRLRRWWFIIPATVASIACQSVGDASIGQLSPTSKPAVGSGSLVYTNTVLGVHQVNDPSQITVDFEPGTPASVARALGEKYGLDLLDGPLISGPLASGHYIFDVPQVDLIATSPSTARVYFPRFTKPADRDAYLARNGLRVLGWKRSENWVMMAEVQLPASNLQARLIDPLRGRFQLIVPADLDVGSVEQWGKSLGLAILSYDPNSGVTIVHPLSWRPPAPPTYLRPRSSRPAPVLPRLYVQFAPGTSSADITAIAQNLGLGVIAIDANDLATFTVSGSKTNAAIQLLSDLASVQCVSASSNPCSAGGAVQAPAPLLKPVPFLQPSTLSAETTGGVLRLEWAASSGATAYAIFSAAGANGPYQLAGVVTGATHFDVLQLIPAGQTVYFRVTALHPCGDSSVQGPCDSTTINPDAAGTPAVGFANPAADASTSSAPAASQTSVGAAQLSASAGVTVAAADGHVTVTWQPVAGAAAYRVYRAKDGGSASYVATTNSVSFTDTGGAVGATYSYSVAAVSANGLVGAWSAGAAALWVASTTAPTVVRSLPAQAMVLAGRVRLEVDAQSGDGRGSAQWTVSGPAATLTLGTAAGQPSHYAPLDWSAALVWDTALVPDGTYTVTVTVIDAGGQQSSLNTRYRVQNSAPPAPSHLTAIAQSGGVALSWQQLATDSAAEYRIFRDDPTTGTPLAAFSADRRQYVDTGATPGRHLYALVLVDGAGHTSLAATASVVISAPPAAQATPALDLQVLLPTGVPLAADGRATDRLLLIGPSVSGLKFQLSSDGRRWADITAPLTCADACITDLSLDSLARGPYLVRAVAPNLASSPRGFVRAEAVRYEAPTGLSASAGPLGVLLSWAAPPGALPASYLLERQVAGAQWHVLDRSPTPSYVDATAPSDLPLAYRVSAVDVEGTAGRTSAAVTLNLASVQLAEEEVLARPSPVTGVEVYASHGRASLRWQPAPDANGYLVERQWEPGGPFVVAGTTGGESFTDVPALNAGQVTYEVIALNGGTQSIESAPVTAVVVPATAPIPVVAPLDPTSAAPAPTSVSTSGVQAGSVRLSWSAPSGTGPSTTYNVYRLTPEAGTFALAATGLETTTFVDSALGSGESYAYVVTSRTTSGVESSFSNAAWATIPSGTPALNVTLSAPLAASTNADNLRALAEVTAAAGLASVSFSIAPLNGAWIDLPSAPANPPLPGRPNSTGIASGAVWGSSFNTNSLLPGVYRLRVQVRDLAGQSSEQVQNLVVAADDARGPPAFALNATPTQGGVRLRWSGVNPGQYFVQRSTFGPGGPFETIASVAATEYDDLLASPGLTYAYRVIAAGSTVATSNLVAAGTSEGWPTAAGAPAVGLGPVSASELSTTIAAASNSQPMTAGLQALSDVFEVDAISLASGRPVHHLGEQAQITFTLPAGLPSDATASVAIYHWDEASASWLQEASTVDASGSSVTAAVDHLSQFVLAHSTPPSGAGVVAQQPAPPTSPSSGTPTFQPPAGMQLQVAADGEVVSLRTATSRVYKNADGTFQQRISAGPMNYQDANGTWQKIDDGLVADAGSSGVHNAANSFHVDIPGAITDRPISISLGAYTVTMALVGATASQLAAAGNHAGYSDVLPGVDAGYDVIATGLKENLVITRRSSTSPVFAFDLQTGSLILRQQQDGTILAVDAAGRAMFTITAPWMYDAAVTETDRGTMSHDVGVTLSGGAGSYRLTYTPSAAWLNDPARRYPVTLDPSWTIYGSSYEYDDQINKYAPNFNYHGYTYLPIGYTYYSSPCCGSQPSRAEIQFTNFLNDGFYASAATLYLYQYTNYGTQRGNPGTTIYVTAPLSSWSYTGVTWNNQPGVSGAYASAKTLGAAGWVGWNVLSLVRAWETHGLSNYGMMLYANAENGPYNNNEFFYGENSGTYPELSITYDIYSYQQLVAFSSRSATPAVPNGGTSPVDVYLYNSGTATWGTDTKLSYRWWSGGVQKTNYTSYVYVPYSVPAGTAVDLHFNLVAPNLPSTASPVYLQLQVSNSTFLFSQLWFGASSSYTCDQFYSPGNDYCGTGAAITLASESSTIAWQGSPQVISAVAGSLITLPLTLTNTSTTAGGNFTWHAYDAADLIRVGIRDYRSTSGSVVPLGGTNLKTYLSADVSPGASTTVNAVIQAPADPGDYLLRFDLVHDTPTSSVWSADQGNAPLEVRARIVAPGDDKTTHVPVPLGDGSSLGVNTSNGFAALSSTDISINERASASLELSRMYSGVNGLLSSTGTSATNATYGLGWTFNFQRSLHLGSLGANTYDPATGTLTDSQGRAWTITWNYARGLYEDAAGNRTITTAPATVVSTSGNMTVPTRPVDLINGSGMVAGDGTAPGGYVLKMETATPPTALILPPGLVPVQQSGSIEFWFEPNFNMTSTAGCHVFFSDAQMRFGLAWNCTTQPWGYATAQMMDFFTYDANANSGLGAYDIVPSQVPITWTTPGWHHISLTWAEGGLKQLMTDTALASHASHDQSPIGDLYFGYEADGTGSNLNFVNGRIAQLRIDGRVVPGTNTIGELFNDAQPGVILSATGNTLYLGHYDQGSPQSAASTYVIHNSDQSIETYSAAGLLQSQADRFGNQIDYAYDASGRILSISDHSISGRSITFAYNGTTVTATDLGGRVVTYSVNANGDLASVSKHNAVPDPLTGNVTYPTAVTTYVYGPNHLLQQVIDPRGARTTVNYDQSYRQVVMIDNPSAYWRLGEVSGTTAADANGLYPAAQHGTVTIAQGGALYGDPNLSYQFDGSTGYVSTSTTITGITNAITLEAWVNHAGVAWSSSYEMVVSVGSSGALYLGVYAGSILMSVYDGTTQRSLLSGSVPATGWHHLVGTWDGSQIRVYMDGTLVATSPVYTEGALSTAGGAVVGAYASPTYYFKGRIDEAAVYASTLSGSRVQAHATAGRLGVGASPSGYAANVTYDSPVAYWRLGDTRAPAAIDQSGAGNNATYTGGYALDQPGAVPMPDNSVSLTGTGYVLSGNVSSQFPNSSVTIEAWFDARGPGVLMDELGQAALNGSSWHDSQIELVDVGGGQAEVRVRVWPLASPGVVLGRVPYNTWNHVVLRYNSATSKLDGFLNGIASTASWTGTRSMPTTGLYYAIGGTDTTNLGSGAYFNGQVDEVAIYSSALPDSRIVAHYQGGKTAPLGGSPYAAAVVSDQPAGYWRLGDLPGSASAADSSGNGRGGTYVTPSAVTLGSSGALLNEPSYAARFSGAAGSYVSLGNLAAYQFGTGTIEAWINTTTTTQSAIAAKYMAWWFGVQSTGKLGFYDMTANAMRDSGVVVNDGKWHHVAAVFQSGVAGGSQMYVDGRPAGAAFQMTVNNQNYELEVAGYDGGIQLLNGSLDEVALYPSMLPVARMLAHIQASRSGLPAATGGDVTTYGANVAADSPLGYWRLGEPAGQVADSSGNGHTSTIANAISYGAAGALPTDSDTALGFNGTSSYVSIPYTASLAPAPSISLEVWLKTSAYPSVIAILLDDENGALAKGAKINFDTTGHAQFQIDPSFNIASGVLTLNAWHHIVGTYDGTYARLYVDGSLVAGPTAVAYAANDGGAVTIGAITNGGTNFWNGAVDEAAIYGYALTPVRVQAHFQAAGDFSQQRVATVQDARGTSIATLNYNDDLATTQVFNGRGLPSYFTFQQYGGRTLSVTDTANDVTRYEYDGGAAYRLMATVSPTGVRQSQFVNSGGPVGQSGQALMTDVSGQPGMTTQVLMWGANPDPTVYGTSTLAGTSESWVWDPTVAFQPGVASHRSTPGVSGSHHHDVTFSNGVLIPAGSQLTQWVFIEAGVQLPGNLMLSLTATDGTAHHAYWGTFNLQGSLGSSCPSNCYEAPMPVAGRWAALTVALGPSEGTGTDVDLAGRIMNGVQFTVVGGTGMVWWGPTTLQLPGAHVNDPTRAVSRYAYNASNDVIASVDPNGIAAITDIDASGMTRVTSTGVPPSSLNLLVDAVNALGTSAWQSEFGYTGTSVAAVTTPQHNGVGSLTQNHTGAGLQSDLYKDVTGLSPGTYVQVSVWVQTQAGAQGIGGASLAVNDGGPAGNNAERRSASIQSAPAQWAQLTLPYIVDGTGKIRIQLWQENFQGTTTWADLRLDDITPAPDVTLQHPIAIYTSGFETQPDASWTLGSATVLNDSTQAHSGQYAISDVLAANNTTNAISRAALATAATSATYNVTAWVKTIASGGGGGIGGAQLCAQFTGSNCVTQAPTEGQWQQVKVSVTGTGNLVLQLIHQNFRGQVIWDDVNVDRVADQNPATTGNWRGTSWTGSVVTTNGAAATWASSWSGGVGGEASRQVNVSAAGQTADISDTLTTSGLRTSASYVFSLWASSNAAGSTLTFAGQTLDAGPTCTLQTTPTLCQRSFTYTGGDKQPATIVIQYGGQGVRTVNISHPLLALASERFDYTAYGQVNHSYDIFGHSTTTTFDANTLYPAQTVVAAAPSPNLTTNDTYNPLGQLILTTRVNGAQSIADQSWVDSWGRPVGEVKNCTPAVAPPALCTAAPGPAVNVMTRVAYDLNGNPTDQFDQSAVAGQWIDTHNVYDANNNRVARVQNCVTVTTPCDGGSSASQNVVTAFAFDVLNNPTDTYSPMPGCTASCVPAPACSAGPPPTCLAAPIQCPVATCVDDHTVFDLANRVFQKISNFNGSGDASQANVTTQFAYDADGRTTDTFTPITSSPAPGTGLIQTGAIDEHKAYDALGRAITDIKAYSIPVWMAAATATATAAARTDTQLDPGGREISVTGPGTGANSTRVVATTDYSDLGRPLFQVADAGGPNAATTRNVYDPRGFVHTWTPPSQQLPGGMETTTTYDLSGHVTAVIKDDGPGELQLRTATSYDAYGRATDVVDPRLIDTNTVYDALDRPVTVTRNYVSGSGTTSDQNVSTGYVYDLAGNQAEVVNPRGIIEYTAYDALHRPVAVVEDCTTVPTPPAASCGLQTSDQNVPTAKTYDQSGALLTTVDSLPRQNVYTYDALGRKTSETDNCVSNVGQCDAGQTSGQNLVTQWQMDAQGDIVVQRAPRSCSTATPCNQGPTGTPVTDGANLVTAYTYDGLLRLRLVTEDQSTAVNHGNLNTYYTYDPSRNKLTEQDGVQYQTSLMTHYTVDDLGRVTAVTDASGNVVTTNYSPAGEVISTVDGRGTTNSNTLDTAGRVTGVTYFKADKTSALTQTFAYDGDGNKTTIGNTDAGTSTIIYDHLNRVSTVTAPLGTTSYTYYLDGSQATVTDPTGITRFSEDRLGRLATMADPLNSSGSVGTLYSYDAAGRLVSRAHSIVKISASTPTIARAASTSVVTQWNADEARTAGHLLLASGSSFGGSTLTISAGWTQVSVVSQAITGGTLRLGLWYRIATGADAAPTISSTGATEVEGSVSEWQGNDPTAPLQASSVGTQTATSGNSIAVTMAAAPSSVGGLSFATYADHLASAATVTEAPGTGWIQENVRTASDTMSLGRDYRLNPSTASADSDTATYTTTGTVNAIAGIVAFFAPAAGAANGVITTAGYTGADQIASKTETSGATTLAAWTNVGYDFAQNRTSETLTYQGTPDPNAGQSLYQYDTVDQLSQSIIPGASGNMTSGYGYDKAHNLTSDAGVSQGYAANESLSQVGAAPITSDKDGNQTTDVSGNALNWNSLSQLESFGTTETYTYDALGRLTTVTNGTNLTQFVYRGLTGEVVEEVAPSGTLAFAWDSTGRQLFVKVGGSVYYEITDLHGDVVALATTTALVGTSHFDPWGDLLSSSGTTIPFGFQGSDGSWTDSTTGFVSMGVRWYYPKVGRFLSSDPAAGTADPRTPMAGLRWLYALNSPLDHSDPTGLRIIPDGGDYTPAPTVTDLCDRYSCPGSPYEAPTVYQAPPPPNKPKNQNCDWRCHLSNGWNALTGGVSNIRPDAGGVQDNLIALGNHMDSGWKQRYRDTLSSSADWVNGTRGDLTSGDPYRIARGTVGVVLFSSNFVPGAGEGVAAVEDVGKVGVTELVDHSPQIEHAVQDALPEAKAEGQNLVDRAVGCAANSFGAATTILMADGSLKAIASLRIGDRVEAVDPLTGQLVAGTVTATYRNQDHQFADLTLVGADGKVRRLQTTQHHLFWDVTRHDWVYALDLAPGDQLLAADGSVVTVESVSIYQGSAVMYDITVDSAHDFFVVVAGASMLVHNCDLGNLPSQIHHYATNKSQQFTAQMQKVADQYGLKLDEEWNKEVLPHLGRHPNEYHQFVLNGMQRAADEAGSAKDTFLNLFDQYVKTPVRLDPGMLRKAWWL